VSHGSDAAMMRAQASASCGVASGRIDSGDGDRSPPRISRAFTPGQDVPKRAAARLWVSSSDTSSMWVASIHTWPNGS
jgi:hypothetical protein